MLKLSNYAGRKWLAFVCVVVFLTGIFLLDASERFSGTHYYLYEGAWMPKATNASRNGTEKDVWKGEHILKMGKQALTKLVDYIHPTNNIFEKTSVRKPNTTEDTKQTVESWSNVTIIGSIFIHTATPYRFPLMPGMNSMDEDLNLPPKIPLNPNSNEPILQYSQKRDYKELISHDSVCGTGGVIDLTLNKFDYSRDIFMLITIKSSCQLIARRDAIRNTWGNEAWIKDNVGVNVKRLFLLGKCENTIARDQVVEEDKKYGDILQWDFHDSFRNLTLKDVLFLQWYARHCQNVPYIFKGDDDIFANIRNLVQTLKDLPLSKRSDLFQGSVLRGSPRILNPKWKYYVSYNLFPDKIYPPYVSGGGFIMSGRLAVQLFQASLSTRLIPIDDAFLGLLLKKIGVQPTNDKGYKSWGMKKSDGCRLAKIKTYHKILPDHLYTAWKEYVTLNVKNCPTDTDDVFRTQMKR